MVCQKSDCFIVVRKPVKAGGAKGAASCRSQRRKQTWHRRPERMEPGTKGIRYQSARYPEVQNLMHKVNEQTLMTEHLRQRRKKATGVDGVNKTVYEEHAEENIRELVEHMRQFKYRPQPVRRTYIPKASGKMRPLGIPAYEDRFLDNSYGFRVKRSTHDVVRYLNQTIMTKKVNYMLEADIKGFFDNVDHKWLMKFLANDIKDKNFVRYADDFLILFQYENEAQLVMNGLKDRLGKFSLEVAEEKTRILPMGRFKGTKEDFEFLGFTFFNTVTRGGRYCLGIRTSKKKLKAKRQASKTWLQTRLTKPVAETMKLLAAVIWGHCNYYGVNGNFHAIQSFWKYLKYSTYRMLNRRDQKGKLRYPKFLRIWNFYISEPHLTTDIWN